MEEGISRWAEESETVAFGLKLVVRKGWEGAPGCGKWLALVNKTLLE